MGYYRLPARTIPLFENQAQTYKNFVNHVATRTIDGSALSYFEDDPPLHPTAGSLHDLVGYVRANQANHVTPTAPPFIDLRDALGPNRAADAVIAAGAITDAERSTIITDAYESSIARFAYRSLWHFEEADEAGFRERRRALASGGPVFNPENRPSEVVGGLPKLPRYARNLDPIVTTTIQTAERLLPPHHAGRLDAPPPVTWSRRPQSGTWAYWTYEINRNGNLVQQIKVNNLLRTRRSKISDQALCYLVLPRAPPPPARRPRPRRRVPPT